MNGSLTEEYNKIMDMRIKLIDTDRDLLFRDLLSAGYGPEALSKEIGVSSRTVRDWRRGKYTIPASYFDQILMLGGKASSEIKYVSLNAYWHTSKAGRLGGKAFMHKYGSLGTMESKAKGGRQSYASRKNNPLDIYAKKTISYPAESKDFAEFIGIMMGDGSISKYQVAITLDNKNDLYYVDYVMKLIEYLFGHKPSLHVRKLARCAVITLSSIELSDYLHSVGLPMGHKLRARLDIPAWVRDVEEYSYACVRGLFDTDGSIYQEMHYYKEKEYCYPRLAFVSGSPVLINSVREILAGAEIVAKIRNDKYLIIEQFTDIEKYFTIIGSNNPKHTNRWYEFGGVG